MANTKQNKKPTDPNLLVHLHVSRCPVWDVVPTRPCPVQAPEWDLKASREQRNCALLPAETLG